MLRESRYEFKILIPCTSYTSKVDVTGRNNAKILDVEERNVTLTNEKNWIFYDFLRQTIYFYSRVFWIIMNNESVRRESVSQSEESQSEKCVDFRILVFNNFEDCLQWYETSCTDERLQVRHLTTKYCDRYFTVWPI